MSDIPFGPIDSAESHAVSLLSRVILPRPGEPLDVRKLYIVESDTNAKRAHAPTRTTLEIGAESEVSFATYFNAFPASYWRRWSTLENVVLHIELSGAGRIDVYRTKATGARITVGGTQFSGQNAVIEFEIGLDAFEDGGWIWFDITSDTEVALHNAGWYAPSAAPGRASITVGIPTFNRPGDCVNALKALTSDPQVDKVITAVIVPDQGTKKAKDHPEWAAAAGPLGDRLRVFNQPNLGGSGGYSRVMYEALKNTDCEQILYMDDDIRIEPDSILRALALSRFAKAPMLVGGQMLNLQEPSHLHVMGEMVNRDNFMWTSAPFAEYDHDFAEFALDDIEHDRSRLLHRRIDVDFNGWWMCMIPRAVAEELGQPLPLFIKWDDVEYGLRANEHGYGTASMPGTAIWHMAWSDKDDAIDWQAYFHLRNRLVVAALHWDSPIRGLLASSLKATFKHLLCLEYSTVAIQNRAIDDFLAGPEHIASILESALPDVRKMRQDFPDAVVLPTATSLPAPSGRRKVHKPPVSLPAIGFRLSRGVIHQLKKEDPAHHVRPELNVATQDARWFLLCRVDGVTVTTADGRGVVYRQRDRAKMFELLRASVRRHLQLMRNFNKMRKTYRNALPTLTSKEQWENILGIEKDNMAAQSVNPGVSA
ncbi:glycosyltransferase [Mycobacterium sp. D16R24]|uniref:glycosyltransferase n=1 Tax=Mycobacterium sp. D16R24 TaxID=1855656 RepID=UPI000992DCBE|nr:glycosyltransferase [Mycobacterium sp. D16R24]